MKSRVPQTLLYLDILVYEPPLLEKLKGGVHLESGSHEEVEIRGCSIWAVEVRLIIFFVKSIKYDQGLIDPLGSISP